MGQRIYWERIRLRERLGFEAIEAYETAGDRTGAAIAIDPDSGAILAFVSEPTYDPNLFVNGIDTDTYKALQDDDNQPLFNRGLRGQYPPGSTLKPFVGLGGLETGITSESAHTFCPGYYQLPGKDRKYRDWKRGGHGTAQQTIVQVGDKQGTRRFAAVIAIDHRRDQATDQERDAEPDKDRSAILPPSQQVFL